MYSRAQLYLRLVLQEEYNYMFRPYVGHLQVVIRLSDQLYRNAWSALEEYWGEGGSISHFNSGPPIVPGYLQVEYSSLLNFRQPPTTSSRSGRNILVRSMFSDIGKEEYNKNIHPSYAVPLASQQLRTWQ